MRLGLGMMLGQAGAGGGGAQSAFWLAYVEDSLEAVYRINIEENTSVKLHDSATLDFGRGCAVDDTRGKIYAAFLLDNTILRLNFDGTSAEVFTTAVTQPSDCVVDEAAALVYVVSGHTTGSLSSFTVAGATQTVLVANFGTDVRAVTQIASGGDLLVRLGGGTLNAEKILRVTPAGATSTVITFPGDNVPGLAVHVGAEVTHVFYGTETGGIRRVELDGSNDVQFIPQAHSGGNLVPGYLAVDGKYLYDADSGIDKIAVFDLFTGAEVTTLTAPVATAIQGIDVSFTEIIE